MAVLAEWESVGSRGFLPVLLAQSGEECLLLANQQSGAAAVVTVNSPRPVLWASVWTRKEQSKSGFCKTGKLVNADFSSWKASSA